ncbi:MAG TPA: C25 family cysteine peptidase [Chloroflexota bacterium]|nr:C25 family cysteine peptidase [Chloroflexota bacterium]
MVLAGLPLPFRSAATIQVGHAGSWLPRPLEAKVKLSGHAIRISITRAGIYRLTYDDLVRDGVDPTGTLVRTLGLESSGRGVPIRVVAKGPVFASGDSIEFFGHPVNNTYTSVNNYVLSDAVSQPRRVTLVAAQRAIKPETTVTSSYIDATRTWMTRYTQGPAYSIDSQWPSTGDPHWYEADLVVGRGDLPRSTSFTVMLRLQGLNRSRDAQCALTVPVVGLARIATVSEPRHQLAVVLHAANGQTHELPDGILVWSSARGIGASVTLHSSFPCSWASRSGQRVPRLELSSRLESGNSEDELLVRYVRVDYPRDLCASDSHIMWQAGYATGYRVGGFTSAHLSVWRVLGSEVDQYAGLRVIRFGKGGCRPGYATSFADREPVAARFVATTSFMRPASVAPINDAPKLELSGSARYLIITSQEFVRAVEPLVRFHEGRGLTVRVASTQSIYDQLAAGQVDPDAIREYVSWAHAYLGTAYVLLVGTDTYDYHNHYRCPASGLCTEANPDNTSVVPTLYERASDGQILASDNLYAVPEDSSNDAPDVAIGRLPVVNPGQLSLQIRKTLQYSEQRRPYLLRAAFAAGWGRRRLGDPDFRPVSDLMKSDLPRGFKAATFYEANTTSHNRVNRQRFLNAFNAGQGLVNYVGHGNASQWSVFPLFTSGDAQGLRNANELSVVLQWSCRATDFVEARSPDLDVTLLNDQDRLDQPTGAVLTLGSTGYDAANPQVLFASGLKDAKGTGVSFFDFLRAGTPVGIAMMEAKDELIQRYGGNPSYRDVVESYTILGDPDVSLGR